MKGKELGMMVGFGVITGVGGFFLGNKQGADSGRDQQVQTPMKGADSSGSLADKNSGAKLAAVNTRGFELSRNPRKGLQELLEEMRNSPMAMMDFESMFNIWDMVQYLDAYEIQTLMDELSKDGGGQEMMMVQMILLNRLAAKDGAAAMDYVLGLEQPMMKMSGAAGAMMGWMRNDPDAAYSWIETNGDKLAGGFGMGKQQFEAMYYAVKARTDFEGTMAKIDSIEGSTKTTVLNQLAQHYATDVDRRNQLLDYMKAKGDEDSLHSVQSSLVTNLTWQDPKGAMAMIDEFNPDPARREELESSVTQTWAHADPKGALEWQVEHLSGDQATGAQIADTFGSWVGQDEAAASEWLRAQNSSYQTDEVFDQAGDNLMHNDPARAAEWYAQVLDDGTRTENYQTLYAVWQSQDQDAANTWRDSLPADMQQNLQTFEAVEE